MVFRRMNPFGRPESEAEDSQSEEEVQDEDETAVFGTSDRPGIAEKVRFWEEQDRINQELIPRVLKQHELLTAHIASHEESRAQLAALDSRIDSLTESLKNETAELEGRMYAEIRSNRRLALLVSCASVGVAILAIILALVV